MGFTAGWERNFTKCRSWRAYFQTRGNSPGNKPEMSVFGNALKMSRFRSCGPPAGAWRGKYLALIFRKVPSICRQVASVGGKTPRMGSEKLHKTPGMCSFWAFEASRLGVSAVGRGGFRCRFRSGSRCFRGVFFVTQNLHSGMRRNWKYLLNYKISFADCQKVRTFGLSKSKTIEN